MLNEECTGVCQNSPTVEEMMAAIKQAQAIPRPECDAIACTDKSWAMLKAEIQVYTCPSAYQYDILAQSFTGIPVHIGSDMIEVISIAIDLAKTGKKVMVIEDKAGKLKVWESSWYDNLVRLTEDYKKLISIPDVFTEPTMMVDEPQWRQNAILFERESV